MSDDALRNFETRKSLHINLTRETHAAFRIVCFKRQLSMQEVLEGLAIQIIENDPHMIKFLSTLERRKRQRAVKKLTATDAESIYKVIGDLDDNEDTQGGVEDVD